MRTNLIDRRPICIAALAAMVTTGGLASAADELRLSSGETLTGRVLERNEESVLFDHPVLGQLRIDAAKIDAITLTPQDESAAPETIQFAMQATEPTPGEWKTKVDIGGGASFGNTDTQNAHAMIDSKRETDEIRTTLDAGYFYGANDGDRSENRLTAGARNDWLMPDEPIFYFGQVRYDYDEFQSWEHRLGAHGGIGRDFIKRSDLTFSGRIGAGVTKEWGSIDEDLTPEGLLGLDVDWQITEKQSLKAGTTLYPDLGDLGEYRLVTTLDWSVLMDEEMAMSLSAGLQHEYQSKVDPGFENNDLRVYAGLQFEF